MLGLKKIDMGDIWLIRHGETAWTLSKQHTGRRDIPMNEVGERHAMAIGKFLNGKSFEIVLVSPLRRAQDTCRLAGYAKCAIVDPVIAEWDYGDFEGKTPLEIRQQIPDWTIWTKGVPGGETLEAITQRAQMTIDRILNIRGDVAIFSHGHFLRVLASCWLGLSSDTARLLMLETGSISILGIENGRRILKRWNIPVSDHLHADQIRGEYEAL
jgi:probable phosphoglycerate mutase